MVERREVLEGRGEEEEEYGEEEGVGEKPVRRKEKGLSNFPPLPPDPHPDEEEEEEVVILCLGLDLEAE